MVNLGPATRTGAEIMRYRTAVSSSIALSGLALLVLLILTRFLQIDPGSPVAQDDDVLFGVDGARRWKQLSGISPLGPRFQVAHPLLVDIWGSLVSGLARLLVMVWPVEAANLYAATGLMCIVAATGFGCLALNALLLNDRPAHVLLLFPVCLLFTGNVLLVQPDHLGLSFGLLAGSTLALLPGLSGRTRMALLCILGFMAAVTTLTNVLFPVLIATIVFRDRISWTNLRRYRSAVVSAVVIAGLLGAAVGVLVVSSRWDGRSRWDRIKKKDTIVSKFLTLRLLRDPLAAARFAGSGLLYPAVGPVPYTFTNLQNIICQSYNRSGLFDYTAMSGVAACAWVALFAASFVGMARSRELRGYWYAILTWLAFNFLFHNLWGDEFFLYSAHWSWAMMLVILLGSRSIPTWAVAAAVLLIIPGQLATLSTIRSLLLPKPTPTATPKPTVIPSPSATPGPSGSPMATPTGSPTGTYPTGTYSSDGTVDIRDTNYPVPAGAYFVATTGNDSNAGNEAAPWKTIGHALTAAPGGSTIVIHGGTYREGSLNLSGKKLTLQPYPHEKVWLKGSLVVSNWVASGSAWRSDGWIAQFALDTPAEAIDSNYPMAPHRDMVFVNGKALRQVGSLAQVAAGTFYADYSNHRLYIGDNPAGKTVEATAQAIALNIVGANGTVVRGLGFEHYATSYAAAQGRAPD